MQAETHWREMTKEWAALRRPSFSDMTKGGTVSVLAARPALAALDERGIDADAPLRAAGLSRATLAGIENRLPWENVPRLWEAAAEAAQDLYFGLHVAEALPVGAYDLIDYLTAASGTVDECLTNFVRYMRLIYDQMPVYFLHEPRCARLVRRLPMPAAQYTEFAMTVNLVRSRWATGIDWSPECVTFQHAAREGGDELARVYRCPLGFSTAESELRVGLESLAHPHVQADSRLLEILMRYANSLLSAMPERGDLVARIYSAIARRMARELPTVGSTAVELRIPERALQRLLARAGLTHSLLVDEVRRGLALKYIGDARLSIGEISFLLHFQDVTGFYRAFKRWTGETPLQYRRQLF